MTDEEEYQDEQDVLQKTTNGFVGCRFCDAVFFRFSEVLAHVIEQHPNKKEELPVSRWFGQSIYLIRMEGSDLCKIGVSQNPKHRLNQLNVPGLYLDMVYQVPHAYEIEKSLHYCYSSKRTKGEWFHLSDEDIAAMSTLIQQLAQDSVSRTRRSIDRLSNHAAKKKAEQFAFLIAPLIAKIETSGITSLQGIAAEMSRLQTAKSNGSVTKWQAIEVSRIKARISELTHS